MSHEALVVRGSGIGAIVPCTVDGTGAITGVGAQQSYTILQDTQVILVVDSASSSQEFVQLLTDHGFTVEVVKLTKTIDATTGLEKATGSGSAGDQIAMGLAEVDYNFMVNMKDIRSTPCLVTVHLGQSVNAANSGWAFVLGKLSGNIDRSTKGEEFVVVKVTFQGQSFTTTAAGDTALTTALAGMTPIGGAEMTPPALVAGDLPDLKAGVAVFKQ